MGYFVVGDVHGCLEKMKELLNHWDRENETLVILGDMIDRGEDSLKVVQYLLALIKYGHHVIVLMGNHEEMFLNWLMEPEDENFYYNQGGRETINSFFGESAAYKRTTEYIAEKIKENHFEEISFLRNLPNYYETEEYIFVHAGVNLDLADWKNTNDKDFKWIREMFIHRKNETGKTIIFGHTLTRNLNSDRMDNVWHSPCGTKVGIDGACVFGGKLHALKINEFGMREISI